MVIEKIGCPQDLKSLSKKELGTLCKEIRELIIKVVSRNGGHLASNLGIVELTLAIHRVFKSPKDKIIWDVGHQSYVHKLITGRQDIFPTLRTLDGMSGFPKRSESEHDIFNTGHSSTSISAGQGIAIANDLQDKNGKVIAVIGDGAMTGGMAFEALNFTGHKKSDLIVILNDNEMSISPNVGAMSMYLHKLRLEPAYTTPKDYLAHVLKQIPGVGNRLYNIISRLEGSLKYLLTPGMLFEEFGFKYFGPVDGYDFETLERALIRAKERKGPVLVHVLTEKGRGYEPALDQCPKFHGIGPFEIETGIVQKADSPPSFTSAFGKAITELAQKDSSIVAITAAMKEGTGLKDFAAKFPNRFFDVGIAEQHAVTMAAGMASAGLKPVVAIYSTFMQRAFDQVIHDVALMDLPVVFCLDRAGIVGEDGPTHHGVFDISYMRTIPGIEFVAPRDELELKQMLIFALSQNKPVAIRFPRGAGTGTKENINDRQPVISGEAEVLKEGADIAIWAVGNMCNKAMLAADKLAEKGINATVINPRFIKPIDKGMLEKYLMTGVPIVTIEEGALAGGFGSAIAEISVDLGYSSKILRIGIEDEFVKHGNADEIRGYLGLDTEGIYSKISNWLKQKGRKKLKLVV